MNFSLVKLSLNNLYDSPFFTAKRFLSIHRSSVIRSFNYFSFNNKNLRISKSNFEKFQNSVIFYESDSYKYTGIISNQINIPSNCHEIILKDAKFNNCKTDLDGGVLNHFSISDGNLICSNCVFNRCHGSKYPGDGGCIYFSGNSSKIAKCCVKECYNYRDGHFAAIPLRCRESYPNHINETSCLSCSNEGSWNTIYQSFGEIVDYSNNYTKCDTCMQSCSFFIHSLYQSCVAKYNYVGECRGAWCAFFYGKERSLIEESVFIKNEVDRNQTVILFYKGGIISNCTLLQNAGSANYFLPKSIDGFATIRNCFVDVEAKEIVGCTFENIKLLNKTETFSIPDLHNYVC